MILKPYKLILKIVLIGLDMDPYYTVFFVVEKMSERISRQKVQPN